MYSIILKADSCLSFEVIIFNLRTNTHIWGCSRPRETKLYQTYNM